MCLFYYLLQRSYVNTVLCINRFQPWTLITYYTTENLFGCLETRTEMEKLETEETKGFYLT